MRRTLLIAACSLFLAGTQAFAADQQKWSKSVENTVSKWEELNLQAPTAVDNAGNTYATGAFTQSIVIGSAVLDPIANSAYLAKYDAEGNVAWAVGLRGAATITAITTDEQNNVYVAGTLADAVEVGSTDGKTQTINGKAGEVENQVSSFIAAYSAEGALKATKVIWSEANAEIAASGLYFPQAGFPYIKINHIEVSNGKLYASAMHTGNVTIGNVQWKGIYMNIFDFMYDDLISAGIFSLDVSALDNAESVAQIGVKTQLGGDQMGVEGINFTTEGNSIYLCFAAKGTLTFTYQNGSEDITLAFDNTNGMVEHAFITTAIQDGKATTKIFHADSHDNGASYNSIGKMQIEGNTLYIGGTFHQMMPFDNKLTHVGGCDLFVTALDKNSLEAQWTAQSGLDEGNGDTQHFNENFTSMAVNNGEVSWYGYVLQDENEKTFTKSLAYTCSNGTATSNDAPLLVTGAATKGTTKALLSANITDFSTTLAAYTVSGGDGINSVKALSAQRVGNTFYFAEPNDITVYDLQGRMLKQANHATSVSIDDLNQGIYILSNGKSTLKAQKTNF